MSDTPLSDSTAESRPGAGAEPSSASAPPLSITPRRQGRWGLWLRLVLWLALVLGLGSSMGWLLGTPTGTVWLLNHMPGLEVDGPQGLLLGNFKARRLKVQLSTAQNSLTFTGLGWQGVSARPRRMGWWLQWKVNIDDLHATRIDIQVTAQDSAPIAPPSHLKLPFELVVKSLRVSEIHHSSVPSRPLRQVQAQLHLGAAGGTEHRIDAASATWEHVRAHGAARVATQTPLTVNVTAGLAQAAQDQRPAWSAAVALQGPLATMALEADVRSFSVGRPTAPPQWLHVQATLHPLAAWPLGLVQARMQGFDLSAFSLKAPVTGLSGQAVGTRRSLNEPMTWQLALTNSQAGLWSANRVPLHRLQLTAQMPRPRSTDAFTLQNLLLELGTADQPAGRITAQGQWQAGVWNVTTRLNGVRPVELDTRAPRMQLQGKADFSGSPSSPTAPASVMVSANLQGLTALPTEPTYTQPTQLSVRARWNSNLLELQEALLQAGNATASLSGTLGRTTSLTPWRVRAQASLLNFDPTLWWPGPALSPWRLAESRLNGKATADITLHSIVQTNAPTPTWTQRLGTLRGQAQANLANNSLLAGVPLAGEWVLRSAGQQPLTSQLKLEAAGNTLQVDGSLDTTGTGANDHWNATLSGPSLNRLTPLWQALQPQATPQQQTLLGGRIHATARVQGRWPLVSSQGQLDTTELRLGRMRVQSAQAQWQWGTSPQAPVDVQATVTDASLSSAPPLATTSSSTSPRRMPGLAQVQLNIKGTGAAHSVVLRGESNALPPAWAQALAASRNGQDIAATRTVGSLQMQGGFTDTNTVKSPSTTTGWQGVIQQLELRPNHAAGPPLLRTADVGLEVQWGAGPTRATLQPGRANVLGSTLRWSRGAWHAAAQQGAFAQVELQAELEPLAVAPLLDRAQPDFGWGGDLTVRGRLELRSAAPSFQADIVLERDAGDLSVTDELGNTQALGLSDLRLGLNANDGVWTFTQGLAGKTLGVAAGAVVARTSPAATWPPGDTPIEGVLELQVANLGTWGTWAPPGWRLDGALRTSASIGGRLNAPQYTGQMRGTGLAVRNFLQGVNVSDGDVLIALEGDTARIERFTAQAGAGRVELQGSAHLGEAPKAQLQLSADRFQLLGRIDRRLITSGQAQLTLEPQSVALSGAFTVDEGTIDFTRSDAPALATDVRVSGRPSNATSAAKNRSTQPATEPADPSPATPARRVDLDLRVNLGTNLRLRGRGLDTQLRGELQLTSPRNLLAVNGSVQTVNGTYAAYGQKLTIDRGLIVFNGPVDNPRLDIEATRPNLDTRVGVAVTGNTANPRVRLFSEPELPEIEKLSWLVLGRGSDGLGRTDTALLQRAALALLAGEGDSVTDQLIKAVGLDDISVRQSDGEVRETVISLGKQLSRRWYVGYERGLNATTGSWQLIYRIAQRFTLRAQSGLDNSLDVIWTWRWK